MVEGPAYVHQVRSHITNLFQSGDLKKVQRGEYCLTAKGKNRILHP
jgi:predicted transcriptional regulator